jgi:NAD(P)-dependent dehydrogenase (short-subunit alcohol dehydrogenase family)
MKREKNNTKEMIREIEKVALERSKNPNEIYNTALMHSELKTAADLSVHLFQEDRWMMPNPIELEDNDIFICFQCRKKVRKVHGIYIKCCLNCGNNNYHHLMQMDVDLKDIVAFITGGRTKIGYQTALRLLRVGAKVIITTRFPERAKEVYNKEFDANKWTDNLYIYDKGLDFNQDCTSLQNDMEKFKRWFGERFDHLDILINVAAQTIRGIERQESGDNSKNRYGDSSHFPDHLANSWNLKLGEIDPMEIQEVFRVNAIAPLMLFQTFLPYMLKSKYERRMVINVHAREGLFNIKGKSSNHPHTNMAKSALHQLTLAINTSVFDHEGEKQRISCYGIDPGWISIDEYGKKSSPFGSPPLTEMDDACRILYPIFSYRKLNRCNYTMRHFTYMSF